RRNARTAHRPWHGGTRPCPLVPCHRSASAALERWLDHGVRPPSSRTLKLPAGADPDKLLTYCPLSG
ncbi:hypothetical protein I3W98_31665, partial [Streptomyces cavourensis]|nr:hypothetical protein [Streptomyces cavourensis]